MDPTEITGDSLSRRGLLLAGGLLAGCTGLGAGGAAAPPQSPLEAANADLVTRFCKEWAKRDVETLVPYLADNLVYQMFEKRPDLVGIAEFRREIGPFLKDLARVDWEILRTHAIGQVVINERVDHFIAKPGGRSMHFTIAGLFVVKNGKIELWRDYSLPG
ncbi:MAG: limonene-1,2-epoxide hydrolase family protein, partial [Gammaproteobacteria bacterium]